jgi:hypothetical protein
MIYLKKPIVYCNFGRFLSCYPLQIRVSELILRTPTTAGFFFHATISL